MGTVTGIDSREINRRVVEKQNEKTISYTQKWHWKNKKVVEKQNEKTMPYTQKWHWGNRRVTEKYREKAGISEKHDKDRVIYETLHEHAVDTDKIMRQEINGMDTAVLSMSHIVVGNPVINDSVETKQEYLKRLKYYTDIENWHERKYVDAELCAYEKIISESTEVKEKHDLDFYRYYILFDVLHVIGYEMMSISQGQKQQIINRYYEDYPSMVKNEKIIYMILELSEEGEYESKLKQLEENSLLRQERKYISLIKKNLEFKNKVPFSVMVTATMSAGKSTFINALTGKYVCLSQNMACTSKIHYILNKAFEDGYSSEYDHDLVLTAGREELLNDNELNTSDKIVVSTVFTGELSDQRIMICDSPGVNYHGDAEHKRITERMINDKNYNLLIYVMNATQLATNDESEHLDYIKENIGSIPVLFIINKIDNYAVEEENLEEIVQRQIEMLKKKGFDNPIVCPVSAKAGYIAKQFNLNSLSRFEKLELYNYIDKFERMRIADYYNRMFRDISVEDAKNEETQLIKTSGLAYVEKIIASMCKGGNING
jgi:GTPase Era involved in 16S rRNA processing